MAESGREVLAAFSARHRKADRHGIFVDIPPDIPIGLHVLVSPPGCFGCGANFSHTPADRLPSPGATRAFEDTHPSFPLLGMQL